MGTPILQAQDLNLNWDFQQMIISYTYRRFLNHSEVSNGFLTNEDEGVLVSDRLAGYLKVTIGDTVILMGQGYHGASAAGIFPVRGIIKMPSPDIDNKLIIMTIPTAQKFFDAEGKITSLSVNLTSKSHRIMSVSTKEN